MRSVVQIISQDGVRITVSAVVNFRVVSPVLTVLQVEDYLTSLRLLASSVLRKVLSCYSLTQILEDRKGIAENIKLGKTEFQAICRVAHYEMEVLM